MEVEPELLPLSKETFSNKTANKSDGARLDVSARGFWTKGKKVFVDVRIFNPLSKSYLQTKPGHVEPPSLLSAYRLNEKSKKREYNERILNVDQGTFTPLVMSTFGGMGYEGQRFIKRLNELIAAKRNETLSDTANFVRIKYSFSLLKTTLMCIRGTRTTQKHHVQLDEVDFAVANEEAKIKK